MKPMMSDKEIDIMTSLLNKDMDCLEWGSGYSTLYFGKMVKSWLAIEHDEKWFNKVKKMTDGLKNISVELRQSEFNNYLDITKKFDFILIDGINRRECFTKAFELLRPNGIVVLHDASRREYKDWINDKRGKVLIGGEIEDGEYYLHRGIKIWKGQNE
jgi:predicted O-methyltransferase YrrM